MCDREASVYCTLKHYEVAGIISARTYIRIPYILVQNKTGVGRGESGRLNIHRSPKIVHTYAQEDGECKEQHNLLYYN